MKNIFSLVTLIGVVSAETIPEIIVNPEKLQSTHISSQNIKEDDIESQLSGNGDIGEVLRLNPNIEVEDLNDDVDSISSLKPNKITINKAKFYQNLFVVDGLSNDSLIDPVNNNNYAIQDVPGNENEFFLDLDLVEEIDVFDSMISAKYGNFSGGVIDVKTKRPRGETFGSVKYKYTGTSQASFHIDTPTTQEQLTTYTNSAKPVFKKQFLNINLGVSINERNSLISAYSYKRSRVSKESFNAQKTVNSYSQNFFLKWSYFFDDAILDVSATYAPYEEEDFLKDVKDSDFKIVNGGGSVNANYEKSYSFWKMRSNLGARYSLNSRLNASNAYKPWLKQGTKTWGLDSESGTSYSKEGGYGEIEKTQSSLEYKLDFDSNTLKLASTNHTFSTGLNLQYAAANYKRNIEAYSYSNATTRTGIKCNGMLSDCDEGVQFFKDRKIYQKEDTDANIATFASYFEDKVSYKRFEFTPGIRTQYNDFLKNVDLDHRLNASYDLFGNKRVILFGGLNRYHAKSFLAFKLREARTPYKSEYRSSSLLEINVDGKPITQWNTSADKGTDQYLYSNLNTPYTDEKVLGLRQQFFNTALTFKYVNRQMREQFTQKINDYKQFTRPDGTIAYYRPITTENGGKTDASIYSIVLTNVKPFKLGSFDFTYRLSTSWDDTTTNYNSYSEDVIEQGNSYVNYNNNNILVTELETVDNPQVYKLLLALSTKNRSLFNKRVNILWSNTIKHTQAHDKIEKTGETGEAIIQGNTETITFYDKYHYKANTELDTKVSLGFKFAKKQELLASVEVNNVFDSVQKRTNSEYGYRVGRQLWLSLAYKF